MSATRESQDSGGGWIEWGGGSNPVPFGKAIDVEYRDGQKRGSLFGSEVDWRHEAMDDDIIAYRIAGE